MHCGKYFALAALIVTGVVAAPAAEPNPPKPNPPPKPAQPTPVQQTNQCGNNATPYCCDTDGKGAYTTCKVLGMILSFFCEVCFAQSLAGAIPSKIMTINELTQMVHRFWFHLQCYNSLLQRQ
jgi:hypothetical protein